MFYIENNISYDKWGGSTIDPLTSPLLSPGKS